MMVRQVKTTVHGHGMKLMIGQMLSENTARRTK
jgi:hypothetical protein